MATQGLVTITHGGKVTHKIIAGCDGYNAPSLASAINGLAGHPTIGDLVDLAHNAGFGCESCLVVIDENSHICQDEELHERYRRTFNQPEFNPRWERGSADYVIVVDR